MEGPASVILLPLPSTLLPHPPARPLPELIAEAAVSSQGLFEAEIEETILGHHVSQKLHGRPAEVALPEEVFLGVAAAPVRAQPGCTCPSVPTPAGIPPPWVSWFCTPDLKRLALRLS